MATGVGQRRLDALDGRRAEGEPQPAAKPAVCQAHCGYAQAQPASATLPSDMGILDDAIREHLELKRQHGAEHEDVERLEKEAFGPVARPGDPEFATGEEPLAEPPSEEQPAVEPPSEEQPAAEQPSAEQAGTETGEWAEPSAQAAEPPSEETPATDQPESGAFGIFDLESESAEAPETPAERARIEHSHLDDTADHPGPVQLGPDAEAELAPGPSAEPEQAPDATEPATSAPDPDATEVVKPEAAAPAAPEAPEAPEADIFADDDFGLEDIDLSVEDEEPGSGEQPAAAEGDAEGEDLLEETPDFLQESEGEDLWFEQGPPRDFDFDDD